MGAAAKTSASSKGGRGRKPAIHTNNKKKPASSSSATSATAAAAAASSKKGTKAAQLESKLAKLAGAGQQQQQQQQQQQPEEEERVEAPAAVPALMDESDAASASSEGGEDAAPAVDPSTSADFVALSSAVQGKLAGGKRGKQQAQQAPNKASKGEKGDPVKAAARQGRILYLGHVPHGFFEEQMRGFFAQFGEVARLRLSRSKKTAKSRGYAFIEFADKEVARIVAETMDGYYLSGRKLVCHALEPAKAHPGLFDDADKTWRVIPWRRLERERREAPKTEQDARKCLSRLLRGDGKRRQKLAKLGIHYAFAGYAAEAHLAAVKRKSDDPEAGKKQLKQTEQAAASKKRGRKEEGGGEAAEQKTAASSAKAGAKGGSKKAKKDGGEASEQRKAPPAVAVVAGAKKRGRAGSEEVEGAPKGKKAPMKKTAAKGAKGK